MIVVAILEAAKAGIRQVNREYNQSKNILNWKHLLPSTFGLSKVSQLEEKS
jgi:hypothetical protein